MSIVCNEPDQSPEAQSQKCVKRLPASGRAGSGVPVTAHKYIRRCRRGCMTQVPVAEYRSWPGLNPSSLAAGLIGKSEVDVRLIHLAMQGQQFERSQATQDRMDRGTLIHMVLLQPERLATDVIVHDFNRRAGAEWEAFAAQHDGTGKLLMRRKDYDEAFAVANTLKNHQYVGGFLDKCKAEVAMWCRHKRADLKGLVDAIDIRGRRIIDIKTTDGGIDQDSVERTVRTFRYREKMAFYRLIAATVTSTHPSAWRCWNLFLSTGDAPAIRKVRITEDALEWGECRMMDAVKKYSEAKRRDDFPIYAVDDFVSVKPWECEEGDDGDVEYE